jgi:hypothetical protein
MNEPVAQMDSAGPETQDVPTEAQADGTSGGRDDLQPLCATGSNMHKRGRPTFGMCVNIGRMVGRPKGADKGARI